MPSDLDKLIVGQDIPSMTRTRLLSMATADASSVAEIGTNSTCATDSVLKPELVDGLGQSLLQTYLEMAYANYIHLMDALKTDFSS